MDILVNETVLDPKYEGCTITSIWKPETCEFVDNVTCKVMSSQDDGDTVYNGTVEYDEDGCFYDPELKASLDYFRYKQFAKSVGVIIIALSVLGIIGNIVSIVVLVLKETKNCFNQLLIALNTFDSLYLIFAILDVIRSDFPHLYEPFNELSPYFLTMVHFPFHRILMCASIYMIMGVGVERYIAVCRPHHYRELQVRNNRALLYIFPSLVAAIALNIPRFFELVVVHYCIDLTDCDCPVGLQSVVTMSDLRKSPDYVLYYTNIAWLIFTGIIPVVVLTILNYKIYHAIQMVKQNLQHRTGNLGAAALRTTNMGKSPVSQITAEDNPESRRIKRANQQNKECNLAFILVCTVVFFFLCHIPRVMTNVYEALIIENESKCQAQKKDYVKLWYLHIIVLTNVLQALNASANLPIYLFGGKSFQASFIALFRLDKCMERQNTCENSPNTEMRVLN